MWQWYLCQIRTAPPPGRSAPYWLVPVWWGPRSGPSKSAPLVRFAGVVGWIVCTKSPPPTSPPYPPPNPPPLPPPPYLPPPYLRLASLDAGASPRTPLK